MQETDDETLPLTDSDHSSYTISEASAPQQFSEPELNDLVRDLGLSRNSAEVLASRLQEKALLDKMTKASYFRNRDRSSLKCILLHNGNLYAAFPVGYSVCLREEYDDVKTAIGLLKHHEDNWTICVDPKMMNVLLSQQRIYKISIFSGLLLFTCVYLAGTWVTFSPLVSEETAEEIVTVAYEAGINLFDLSEAYSGGRAEIQLGNILKKKGWRRSSYHVITKVYWNSKGDERGLSRKHIIESVKSSLERLQLDYIDVIIIHRADDMCPMEEVVRAASHCIDQGWCMYWGTSRWSAVEIMEAWTNCRQFNCITPIVEQSEYHLFCRSKTELYLPEIYNKIGVGTMAWSPLAIGLISSKMDDGMPVFTRQSFKVT
ncbi:voltage-gated potassium channel subunit beta-2-like [Penaeus indicus]|uniref:voltage-gated potassium channel subunit beta-2-like n=1 Tax=Penaeus indicus TaxID=29960 RepID=UPI00300C4B81